MLKIRDNTGALVAVLKDEDSEPQLTQVGIDKGKVEEKKVEEIVEEGDK